MSEFYSFNKAKFKQLFPFSFQVNENMQLVDCGSSFYKIHNVVKDANFLNLFKIIRPNTEIKSFKDLIALQDQLILLEYIYGNKIIMRGEIVYQEQDMEIIFLGSPWFSHIEELKEHNLTIDDFAKNDPLIDLLHLLKTVEITNDDLRKLVNTINFQKEELKSVSEEVKDIAQFTNQNPDPNIRVDFEGNILQNNPAASNLDFIEYKGEVYRIDSFFKILVSQIDKNEKNWSFEAKSNDTYYSFECVILNDDGFINMYGRDVTEQKHTQLELEKISTIVKETFNAVIVTTPDGKIDWVNKAFETMTGYTYKEVKGKIPGKFLQGELTSQETMNFMGEKLSNKEAFTCEVYNYSKQGRGYWVRINCQPIFDSEGNLLNFFAIEKDITIQKESQEEISKFANRMSTLISNYRDGILLETKDKTIELVNKRFCEFFSIDVDPDYLIGADCSNAAEDSKNLFKDPDSFVANIEKIVEKREPVYAEQLEMVNGKILERDFIPIWNEGVYEGHLWVYSDITDKINLNNRLKKVRDFYEKILDNMPSDISVLDVNRRYLYVNAHSLQDLNLRQWIIGKSDDDYYNIIKHMPHIPENRKRVFTEVLKEKKLQSFEEEFINKDGTTKYIMRYYYPIIDSKEEIDLVISYSADVTNLKNIQQQIQQSEKQYRDVIEHSLAVITTHDLEGNYLSANPMVTKIYGYEENEVVGHNIREFMFEEDRPYFGEVYLKKIIEDKEATGIFKVRSKKGREVFTLYNNFLREEEGKEPYVIGFSVDITQRILIEKELQEEKKHSEYLAMAKHNFLANMSHEIRTPMNAIMGMSRQLQKSDLGEKEQEYLENITTASENLLVIINDVLDLSKLEAGKLSVEEIGFELNKVLNNAVQVMQLKADEKGIKLTQSSCDSKMAPILIGDPYRLNQVLLNLLSNAIKFTNEGVVDVCCKVIKDTKKHQEIQLKVSDTGIGMKKEFLDNLFEKFTQEYKNTAKKYGGTGLGMNISKSLIDLMGGTIEVESEKGKGTTFYVNLKLQKGTKVDLSQNKVDLNPSKNIKGSKILVVDDNVMNRMVATLLLKEFDVLYDEANDGAEAVEYLKNNQCDLVLMDIQMPNLNGFEATEIIRNDLKLTLPIIALTANAIKGEREKCIENGMNDYLSKPFDEDQLFEILTTWL